MNNLELGRLTRRAFISAFAGGAIALATTSFDLEETQAACDRPKESDTPFVSSRWSLTILTEDSKTAPVGTTVRITSRDDERILPKGEISGTDKVIGRINGTDLFLIENGLGIVLMQDGSNLAEKVYELNRPCNDRRDILYCGEWINVRALEIIQRRKLGVGSDGIDVYSNDPGRTKLPERYCRDRVYITLRMESEVIK